MTTDQFIQLLERYGADFQRWPEAQRLAGEELRDHSPRARAQWQAIADLEALLVRDRQRLEPEAARTRTIIDAVMVRLRPLPDAIFFDWRWLIGRRVGFALGMTIVAGFVAGLLISPEQQLRQRGVPLVTALLAYELLDREGGIP